MPDTVEVDEPANLSDVLLLGAIAVVTQANLVAHPIEETRTDGLRHNIPVCYPSTRPRMLNSNSHLHGALRCYFGYLSKFVPLFGGLISS